MNNIKELKEQIRKIPSDYFELLDKYEKQIFNNYKLMPIEILVKADWNYKADDEEKSNKLTNNIKRIGQVENIQVRELDTGYYEVINGNHRLDCLQKIDKKY